jgi:starch phosphorylase
VAAKARLLQYIQMSTGATFEPDVFTISFARRAATYKRANLLFHDLERLRRIHKDVGRMQVVYAGKSHPRDEGGKDLIRQIFAARDALRDDIAVAYLSNYDIEIGRLLVAGVDVWLNTPEPPLEASGTSGMKAAINGVPSLSTLDGWWLEGWIEGITGWSIGRDREPGHVAADRARVAAALYDKLEHVILPLFYHDRDRYEDVMRNSIALNGSFFNVERMMQEYVTKAYRVGGA